LGESNGLAITVEGLRKTYGDLTAVDGISFEVHEGEFFGILGPNGAGKTTTMEMVEGLRKPDDGTIRIFGESPWPRNTGLLKRIGIQLQASAFFDKLTSIEQLGTFASLYGVGKDKAGEMLELVGMTEKADTREDKLSGGQKQRLSIACALVHDPDVVFLDEPTSGLDPQARRNLWDVLESIRERGKTIVYTTHYLEEAEELCDRVAIMESGKLLALDTPANLVEGLAAPTRVLLKQGVISAELARGINGVDFAAEENDLLTMTTRAPGPVLAYLADNVSLDTLQVRTTTLEDVFLNLTGREYRE
jgi:ABC-2 type transport system ATP-binding protein